MSATPDSYHRTEDFETRVDSVMLPDEAWAVFAQLDKPTTTAEIAAALGCDAAAAQKHIDLLIQHKLVRKKLVNWREFLAQKGINSGPTRMSPAGPQPAPAVLAAQARKPSPPPQATPKFPAPTGRASVPTTMPTAPAAPVTPPRRPAVRVETPDPDGTITFRLDNDHARRARRASLAMCITFRLEAGGRPPAVRVAPAAPAPIEETPTVPAMQEPESVSVTAPEPEPALVAAGGGTTDEVFAPAPVGGFTPRRLRTLIDAITRKGGGGLNGQLLVYRVFLRVPPALMFAAGIKSLNLIDDTLELQDERTYDAIRTAARAVASIELDEVAV